MQNIDSFSSAKAAMHESTCMLVDMWGSGGLTGAIGCRQGGWMGSRDIGRLALLRRPMWWSLGGRSSPVGNIHLQS